MSKFTFRQLIEAAKQSGELREGDVDYVHGLFMDSYDFATLIALQEENAALREDKTRLDWLQSMSDSLGVTHFCAGTRLKVYGRIDGVYHEGDGATVREAIDFARR